MARSGKDRNLQSFVLFDNGLSTAIELEVRATEIPGKKSPAIVALPGFDESPRA